MQLSAFSVITQPVESQLGGSVPFRESIEVDCFYDPLLSWTELHVAVLCLSCIYAGSCENT